MRDSVLGREGPLEKRSSPSRTHHLGSPQAEEPRGLRSQSQTWLKQPSMHMYKGQMQSAVTSYTPMRQPAI